MTPTAAQAPLWAAAPATVLGIDPGSTLCGWGVVRREGRQVKHVRSGTIRAKGAPYQRLAQIHDAVAELVLETEPDVVAVEDAFVGKFPRAAIAVGQARGAVLAAIGRAAAVLGRKSMPLEHLPPGVTKKLLTGNGQAKKPVVALAVRAVLRLAETPQEDEADALAAAVTAARRWRR